MRRIAASWKTRCKKTEKQYQDLLSSQSLTEQERKALQENLEMVQGQLRSKEEQLQVEKKQIEETYAAKLQEMEKKASFFETLYRDSTIERALQDAAVKHEAWSPSQVVTLLRGQTKMLEVTDAKTGKLTGKYNPMVEMAVRQFDDRRESRPRHIRPRTP